MPEQALDVIANLLNFSCSGTDYVSSPSLPSSILLSTVEAVELRAVKGGFLTRGWGPPLSTLLRDWCEAPLTSP